MLDTLIQITGILGAIILLYAYAMISRGKLTYTSPVYHVCNLIGALLVGINTAYTAALGALLLNVIWMGISIRHLLKPADAD
ncbi:MAG TPA: hypothetical protein ENI99_01850 [Sedimenticola sp.]|nr:hypothetical protein [Sedimenticola sp.]